MTDRLPAETYNRRLGLWLFLVYFLMYGTFVALVAHNYKSVAGHAFGGINIAIVYGMGLIIGAFVLALIYMGMARNESATEKGTA